MRARQFQLRDVFLFCLFERGDLALYIINKGRSRRPRPRHPSYGSPPHLVAGELSQPNRVARHATTLGDGPGYHLVSRELQRHQARTLRDRASPLGLQLLPPMETLAQRVPSCRTHAGIGSVAVVSSTRGRGGFPLSVPRQGGDALRSVASSRTHPRRTTPDGAL